MLKASEIELELLIDINIYNFIKQGVRGGIVQCSKRHVTANTSMYVYVNNLYGYAMSQYLPYKNFKWLDNCNVFNVTTVDEDSEFGHILQEGLEYPTILHDHYSDVPFYVENKKNENLKYRKIITDLNDKINYIIHYRNL